MSHHIDVSTLLRGAVCELYSNLVTRPTGAAVRSAIEALLAERHPPTITTIDFSRVNLLDFSCADEIVAKLLLRQVEAAHAEVAPVDDHYVYFRGMRDDHLDAVEAVLERRALALVWDLDGVPALLGQVDAVEREHWEYVRSGGPVLAPSVAVALGAPVELTVATLDRLWRRRLVMRRSDGFLVPRDMSGVAA
jgi:hypothetical protein